MAETAGNPFLVTEMLRTPLDAADAPIPVGVQELVVGRLGRLGDTAIDLLGAAVAGASFELDLVAAAAGLDEVATLDALDAALGSGLVAEETAERYRFPHDIVRRTLVAQLSGARRRALHARLAEAIESQRADRLHAYTAILAHHTSSAAGLGRPTGGPLVAPPPPRRPSAGRWSRPSGWNARRWRTCRRTMAASGPRCSPTWRWPCWPPVIPAGSQP